MSWSIMASPTLYSPIVEMLTKELRSLDSCNDPETIPIASRRRLAAGVASYGCCGFHLGLPSPSAGGGVTVGVRRFHLPGHAMSPDESVWPWAVAADTARWLCLGHPHPDSEGLVKATSLSSVSIMSLGILATGVRLPIG